MPLLELARAVQDRGLASIYLPEHTHMPVDPGAYPGGGSAPERYARLLDPLIASSWVAATTTLEVGTAVALPAAHDAIALAKAVATLDWLSCGRLVLGVGCGWNANEALAHGVSPGDRWATVQEKVELMRSLWTEDEARYDGRFVQLPPSMAWPKPRHGGPPVLVGGLGMPQTFTRVAEWADGWIPLGHSVLDEPDLPSQLRELRSTWNRAGRDSAALHVSAFFPPAGACEMARTLERAGQLGVGRIQVLLEDRTAEDVLPILDELAMAVAMCRP